MPIELPHRIVIVGAGHGGATAAALLRQQGFDRAVTLIGAEPVGPYHRPPLSKSLLKGDLEQPLQPGAFYREHGIELRTGMGVAAVDREARLVRLVDGQTLEYDVLILATGAKARKLTVPGVDLEKVYELRTLSHARVLQDVLNPGRHLAIVGGGWIGLEVAASARSVGVEVTVIEREPRLLSRVASPELSGYLTEYHLARGTRILTTVNVTRLVPGVRGMVKEVILDDGRAIACDRVLVGVGAVADDELARTAGLPCGDGVIVDWCARTADPQIYAIGDMTRRPVRHHEGLFRVESIPSAVEQARQAVHAILGKPPPAAEVPWFWSDQFDLKLQIAGLLRGPDSTIVRSDPATNKLAVFHTKERRLVAVEGVNAPAEFMAGKHLIREQTELDLDRLGDPAVALDKVARAPTQSMTSKKAAGVAIELPLPRVPDAPPEAGPVSGRAGNSGKPRVTYIQPDGTAASVEITVGLTVMDGSVRNNLPGIIAECGGMCSCGTCHVYIEAPWQGQLDKPEIEEEDLLEFIEDRQPTSRLSCQIVMTDDLDGLVVRVADFSG